MDRDDFAGTLLTCYRALRQSDNEQVAEATRWLEDFYAQRESLVVIGDILRTVPDAFLRHHAAIGLKASVSQHWGALSPSEGDSLFDLILSVALNEPAAEVRSSIIPSMVSVMSPEYSAHVLTTIQSLRPDHSLAAIANVLEVVCKTPDVVSNAAVEHFILDVVERCFAGDSLELGFAAFHFVICASRSHVFGTLEFCWQHLLGLFDACLTSARDLEHLTILFNDLLGEASWVIDCRSLFDRLLDILSAGDLDVPSRLLVFSVVSSICEVGEFLSLLTANDLIAPILQIAFELFQQSFDPADCLASSQFLESFVQTLVWPAGTHLFFPLLWDMCKDVADSDLGRFGALCALKGAECEEGRSFFHDKVVHLAKLCCECLNSAIPSMQVVAASAVEEFSEIFSRTNVPDLLVIARELLECFRATPTQDFLNPLRCLLGAIHDTREIFDDVIETMLHFAATSEPDAIQCIISVMAGGGDKVTEYVQQIVAVMNQGLKEDDTVQVHSLRLFAQLVKSQYSDFEAQGEIWTFLRSQTQSEEHLIAMLSILKTIFTDYPDAIVDWETIDFPRFIELASEDLSEQFKIKLSGPPDSWDDGVSFDRHCECSALTLRVLSLSLIMNEANFRNYSQAVLQICSRQIEWEFHTNNTEACHAMFDIVRASAKFRDVSEDLLNQALSSLSSFAVIADAVRIISKIVFDMGLRVGNVVEIYDLLLQSFEKFEDDGHDSPSIEFLILKLIHVAAVTTPDEAVSFATAKIEELGEVESPHAEFCLLFPVAATILALPGSFPGDVKQEVISRLIAKVAEGFAEVGAIYLLGGLAKPEMQDIAGVWRPTVDLLQQTAADEALVPGVRNYAVLSLMSLVMNFATAETVETFAQELLVILGRLPLPKSVETGDEQMAKFVLWLRELTAEFNMQLIKVGINWFMRGIEVVHLELLRGLLRGLIGGLDDAQNIIAGLCGNDQLALQNLQDLLENPE
jgi:hypothetical protein